MAEPMRSQEEGIVLCSNSNRFAPRPASVNAPTSVYYSHAYSEGVHKVGNSTVLEAERRTCG
jgi:hypothetical protein